MKFSVAAAALFAAGAYATPANVSYTTEIVTVLTTYCPFATTLTHNGKTYTASSVRCIPVLVTSSPFEDPELGTRGSGYLG